MIQEITVRVQGTLRIYEMPMSLAWMHEDMRQQIWCGMSDEHKASYLMNEYDNLITNGGLNDISSYLGNYSTLNGFALWLALGNGILNGVSASDASLGNEIARYQPTSSTITGNQTAISVPFTVGSSAMTITEAGLYGGAATSTANSGSLHTHLLCSATFLAFHMYTLSYLLIRN